MQLSGFKVNFHGGLLSFNTIGLQWDWSGDWGDTIVWFSLPATVQTSGELSADVIASFCCNLLFDIGCCKLGSHAAQHWGEFCGYDDGLAVIEFMVFPVPTAHFPFIQFISRMRCVMTSWLLMQLETFWNDENILVGMRHISKLCEQL